MRIVFLTLSLITSLSACSTIPTFPELHADPDLVRHYSFALEDERPFSSPYVARFSRGGKTLVYVASKHLSLKTDPKPLESATLKTIAKVFEDERPQVVIVEGLHSGEELSPKSVLRYADRCKESGYLSGCGESFFAINQARKTGIQFLTGEPSDSLILTEIKAAGFSAEDLLGFYLVRQIPELKRQKELSADNFSHQAEHLLASFRRDLKSEVKFGFDDFKKWYARQMPRPANFLDVETDDSAPEGGPAATYTQKISHRVSLTRDRNIVMTIERMLNRYDRVLVVYGSSHLLTEKPALEKMLGPAQCEKRF